MSVVVFGATSRIAQAICHAFGEAGHAVFVAARDGDEAERVAADVAIKTGAHTASGTFDALAMDAHDELIARVVDAVGPIDVAVVAFGDMGDQTAAEADFAAARRILDVNFTGAASICEAVARHVVDRGAGTIVGVGSVAGDRGRKSNYFYGSAKGAFALYLQGLRNRVCDDGVRVLTVKLGFVDTRMTFGMASRIPVAQPEDAATAIRRAVDRGAEVLYYPRFWRGIMGVIRAVPERLFKRLSL